MTDSELRKMMPVLMVMMTLMIVAAFFVIKGFLMHQQVNVAELQFHALQADYFIQSKALRDAAETGSELNRNLVQIQNFPSELLRLKLVGVGNILIGISILLLAILMSLMMMPVRLGKHITKHLG